MTGNKKTVCWAAGLGVLLLAVCIIFFNFQADTLGQIRRKGVIRIGYAVEPPYAFLTDRGEVTGESPEAAREIVRRLQIPRVEWRLMEFGSLMSELEEGRIDVIATGMFITEERKKRLAFSSPTCKVEQGLLVRKGNPEKLHSYQDLSQNDHVTVVVIGGSVEERLMMETGMHAERTYHVPDALSGLAAVESGKADAMALSAPALRWMIRDGHFQNVEMAVPFTAGGSAAKGGEVGFGFRPGDTAFRDNWDKAQKNYVGSSSHKAMLKSFGFADAEMPLMRNVEKAETHR